VPEKLERCVDKVKGEKGVDSAYAICNSSLKEEVANAMVSMKDKLEETDELFREHDNPLDIPFGYELNVNETDNPMDIPFGREVHETVCKPCVQEKYNKKQVMESMLDSRTD